jgi:alkanesulfonate monooxygenase SsuD/methylene tetrahydromethanopterin reductase-like flavin-dependent oxidoreductase (luciferase family)
MAQLDFAVSEEGLLNYFDDVPEAVDRYETLIREVQLEEELGFKYHFIIEHQNVHFGQLQSPMVYLAALAQRTSTIRFAQMVFATPFHHPMRFAMDTAMIDQLSRGRLEVGVGSGANRFETDRWNLDYSERRTRFPEFMEIVKKAWTEECVTYDGKYWQLDNAIALPRPYQKPHPPIWFAGRSRESLEWAAANSANYGNFLVYDHEIAETFRQYREVCREFGHTEESMPLNYLFRCVYVAETDEQAHREMTTYLPQAYAWGENKYNSIPNLGSYDHGGDRTRANYQEIFRGMRTGIDFWLDNNLAYVGSPETVIQRIRETQKLTGFNVFGARFRFGAMSDEMVMNSIRLFGEKVIPAFADVPASAAQAGS